MSPQQRKTVVETAERIKLLEEVVADCGRALGSGEGLQTMPKLAAGVIEKHASREVAARFLDEVRTAALRELEEIELP